MFCVQCGATKDGTTAACAACGHVVAAVSSPELIQRMSSATNDAGATLAILRANPTGSLVAAYASLGEQRALGAGVVLGLIFAISAMLASGIGAMRMHVGFQPRLLFGALMVGLVLFASLAAVGTAGRKLLRGSGTLGSDVFLSGIALLPIAVLLLISSILSAGNFEVIAIAAVVSSTYLLCILYVGVTRLMGISEALAPPFIAAMLLLSLWLSKVVLVAIVGGFNPFGRTFGG